MTLRLALFSLVLLGTLLLSALWLPGMLAAPRLPTPDSTASSLQPGGLVEQAVQQAIADAIRAQRADEPALALFETRIEGLRISQDQTWAVAWMTPVDPDTQQVIPTEPGLALVKRVNGQWQVFLPSALGWVDALRQAPTELVPQERKDGWLMMADARPLAAGPSAPLGGYRLPYAGGETMRLTQSVGHDRYTASGSAHFSFDFATPGYPSKMFNVHAARSGVVRRVHWDQANGSEADPGNYIVLEDTGTTPTSYQLYLHLAQDSIPENLRVIGTAVQRGQFLGIADDTGASSGNHLHFMVHTNPSSYWGTGVDIVFEDVTINGGRPRIPSDRSYCKSSDVCDTFQSDYVSNNYFSSDSVAPIGNLTSPLAGETLAGTSADLNAWVLDEGSGIASAQFIARLNGSWQPVGSPTTGNLLSMAWNLCAAGAPEGPLDVALSIRDRAGNNAPGLPGLTHFSWQGGCASPLPACSPNANQAALFAEKDYRGACVTLDVGSYPTASSLGAVGDNAASSLLLGANVQATLFNDPNLQGGRGETFTRSDANLADNPIGKNAVSALVVQTRGAAPSAPLPVWPPDGASFASDATLGLSWQDRAGAVQFQARLLQNGAAVQTSPWLNENTWRASRLPVGNYTWQVKARGETLESDWSAARSLQIAPAAVASPAVDAPYSPTFESAAPGWTASPGWSLTGAVNHTPQGNQSWAYAPGGETYNTGAANAGWLTSPPIRLPARGASFLRFWYQYETESSEAHWDQRWVQISVDGGPFIDLAQLSGDPPNHWLQSPAYSLAAYAGKTVQARFFFASLDPLYNGYRGWFIDDVSLTSEAPPACSDADDQPSLATPIQYGASVPAAICPSGEVDYYAFQGSAGDTLGAWLEAKVNGSPLDGYLSLLDADGRSVLEKNDDQVQYQRPDPWLTYRLARSGTYYLKVTPWDHPSAGGPAYTYTLRLVKDTQRPTGSFITPGPNHSLDGAPAAIQVQAADAQSGVSHVVFLWHASDWQGSDWVALGEDWDGRDGWGLTIPAEPPRSLPGGSVYVKIYDWAGNWTGLGVWTLNAPGLYLPVVFKPR